MFAVLNGTDGHLHYAEVPNPSLAPDQVLVKVHAAALNRANLVISQRGKEGGYRLSRPASDITVAEVLHSTEGSMAAVSCLDAGENGCERAAQCLTLPMWKKLDAVMDNYLSGVSVQDLLDGKA